MAGSIYPSLTIDIALVVMRPFSKYQEPRTKADNVSGVESGSGLGPTELPNNASIFSSVIRVKKIFGSGVRINNWPYSLTITEVVSTPFIVIEFLIREECFNYKNTSLLLSELANPIEKFESFNNTQSLPL